MGTSRDISDVIQQIFQSHPERLALCSTKSSITYSQLSSRVACLQDQICKVLPERYKTQKTCVILHLPNSMAFVETLLALVHLKCPFASVPLGTPRAKLEFIARDVGASVIITTPQQLKDGVIINKSDRELCRISKADLNLDEDLVIMETETNAADKSVTLSNDCCYIMYTSGSTGDPKGVQCLRPAVLNMAQGQIQAFKLEQEDVTAQFASIGFDAVISELFTTFISGGTLAVLYQDERAGEELQETLKELKVTVITLPASLLETYQRKDFPTLKKLITAGEACSKRVANAWASSGDLFFFNAYGAVETTVCATVHECATVFEYTKSEDEDEEEVQDSQNDLGGDLPIGKAIQNVSVNVLDENLKEVPVGTVGEICVGGAGLSLGYIGHAEEQTKERFVDDPSNPGQLIYRTGDQGKLSASGDLTFCGRVDDQRKIRGQMVNLKGIEEIILSCEGVTHATVVIHQLNQSDPSIAAFVSPKWMSKSFLKAELEKRLSCHEIPSHFKMMDLENFPRNASGKIDKIALSKDDSIVLAGPVDGARQTPMMDEMHMEIAKVWCEVLELGDDEIPKLAGRTFIEAGGNSIKLIKLQKSLKAAFSVLLKFETLSKAQTIDAQATLIRQMKQ